MCEAGYIAGTNLGFKISKNAANQSILITGVSGNGKTMAMRKIAVNEAKSGHRMLIINYGNTHDEILFDDQEYHVIDAKKEGVPLPLFEHFSYSSGDVEEDMDVCEAVTDAFLNGTKLGYVGRNLLDKACQNALDHREQYDDDMQCLYYGIKLLEEDEESYLMAKFQNIFKRVKFHKKMNLWWHGQVTVLDISGYPESIQNILIQLILSVSWRYHQAYGRQAEMRTTVILDEFQNIPLKKGSILSRILCEGRKFNLSLMLATQTLSVFDTGTRILLQQPAIKLYFKPTESEVKRMAKHFPDIRPEDAERLLKNLGIGECLAYGSFEIAGISKVRTLLVNFL